MESVKRVHAANMNLFTILYENTVEILILLMENQ